MYVQIDIQKKYFICEAMQNYTQTSFHKACTCLVKMAPVGMWLVKKDMQIVFLHRSACAGGKNSTLQECSCQEEHVNSCPF